MALVLTELADLARWRGDWERAAALTDEAPDLCRQLDAVEDIAQLLSRRAAGSIGAGDLAGAEADYERAAGLARRAGAPELLAGADSGLGEVARLRGDLAQARRRCEKALAECPTGWFIADETRAYTLVALGRIAEAEHDAGEARAWHRRALGAGRTVAPSVAEALAGVALLEGDGERAALLLGVGRALRGTAVAGDPDVARVSAAARAQIGVAAYERAYRQGAAMARDQALTLLGAPPSASGA